MTGSMASQDSASKPTGRWFRQRQIRVPTWRGWLVLLTLAIVLLCVFARTVHPFLAVRDASQGGLLVIEGWAPDFALKQALREFESGHYQQLIVTGGPLERGAPLAKYQTYAELGTATLLALGAPSNAVVAVPAPAVRRDRTYQSGLSLLDYLEEHRTQQPIHILTVGAHARRSKLLFKKALGEHYTVTTYAIEEIEYDSRHWWRYSSGVRSVIGELIAYSYAKLLFNPSENQ
jgi:hypothetical protein